MTHNNFLRFFFSAALFYVSLPLFFPPPFKLNPLMI